MRPFPAIVVASLVVFSAGAVAAAAPPVTCQASKLKTAAKYASCRLGAESRAAKTTTPADFGKCDSALTSKWAKAEAKAGSGVCPSEGDQASILSRIAADAGDVAILLAGGSLASCGDGVAGVDEQCDGADLDGTTCEALGFTLGGALACTTGCAFDASACVSERVPASGQTASYGIGDDGYVESGATLAFDDNGDGTISDLNTGLMWEKKILASADVTVCGNETGNCANPHQLYNRYSWSASGSAFDGSVATVFLDQLNNRCTGDMTNVCETNADCALLDRPCGLGGYRDWRLPNIKELLGIIDFSSTGPSLLHAAFHGAGCGTACTDLGDPACSCDNTASVEWSSTTTADRVWEARTFATSTLYVGSLSKRDYFWPARAVRGGS